MKKIIVAVVSMLLLSGVASASTPAQEKEFIDSYKKAFEGKDGTKLESFLYTKDANPDALEFYKMMMTSDMGSKITNIELRALTPEEAKKAASVQPGPDGVNSKLPVVPTKKLVLSIQITDANGSSSSSSESFVAEVDGKLLIPVPATVK